MHACKTHRAASWTLRIVAASILGQTLFFKFTGAPESKFIFSTLGAEPWGRVVTGCAELLAVLLLLTPQWVAIGAALAAALMAGALGAHLTRLGIEVQGDHGLLFALAVIVFGCSACLLVLHRHRLPFLSTAAPVNPDASRILTAAIAILRQGEELLSATRPEVYTRRVPLAFNGNIGGHYRHCLDHFTSLLRGLNAAEVDYDHRERDARIEAEPDFALAQTLRVRQQLEALPPAALAEIVQARCEVSYAPGQSPVTGSTFGREVVYAIAHAIHHYALISVMARLLEVRLPPDFGVAPSTVAHEGRTGQRHATAS